MSLDMDRVSSRSLRCPIAGGRTRRIDIALIVDARLPRGEARELRRAVATAAGLDPSRGDSLRLSRLPLSSRATDGEDAARWWTSPSRLRESGDRPLYLPPHAT